MILPGNSFECIVKAAQLKEMPMHWWPEASSLNSLFLPVWELRIGVLVQLIDLLEYVFEVWASNAF